jgi:hypothetical protein
MTSKALSDYDELMIWTNSILKRSSKDLSNGGGAFVALLQQTDQHAAPVSHAGNCLDHEYYYGWAGLC